MKDATPTSRRHFLRSAVATGAAFVMGAVSACGRGSREQEEAVDTSDGPSSDAPAAASGRAMDDSANPCTDLSGLTPEQREFRSDAGYVDRSEDPAEHCDICAYWKPPRGGGPCGGCTAVAGPIAPAATCDLWEEKA